MVNFLNTKFDTGLNTDIFRAMSVAKIHKSDDELANLSKNVDALVGAKKVSSGDTGEFSNAIYFQDVQSGEYVKLGLSDKNLQAIRDKFDKSDFFARDDGSIIFSGVAEAYVAGWFGDIAYNREYLKADSDNDGFLDKAQMANTKSAFKETGIYEIKNGSVSLVKTTDVISHQKAAVAGLSSASIPKKKSENVKFRPIHVVGKSVTKINYV